MMRDAPNTALLFELELDSNSVMSPFFWRRTPSHVQTSEWVWGFIGTEYDPKEAGEVTVIRRFRGTDEPAELPSLKGFEVLEGEPLAVGDWNGDGENELVVVDWEGRLRAFGFDGRPVEGIATRPSTARLVAHRPCVLDVNGDGRPELVVLSREAPLADAVSLLSIYDASGKAMPGLPLTLDPPAVSSLAIASTRSGARRLAFVREDGSVSAYDVESRDLRTLVTVSPDAAESVSIAAADLDSDGEDELFLATGGETLDRVAAGPESTSRETAFEREDSAIVAVASGMRRDGRPVLCTYDRASCEFAFLPDGEVVSLPNTPASRERRLASLSTVAATGERGDTFVALFYQPPQERNVDAVFEKHATHDMRRAWADADPEQKLPDQGRRLKRSLLIDELGHQEAQEILLRPGATEVYLLDPNGTLFGGAPLRLGGFHPFIEEDEMRPVVPAVLYHDGRLLLLVGLCEDTSDGDACVWMYEFPGH